MIYELCMIVANSITDRNTLIFKGLPSLGEERNKRAEEEEQMNKVQERERIALEDEIRLKADQVEANRIKGLILEDLNRKEEQRLEREKKEVDEEERRGDRLIDLGDSTSRVVRMKIWKGELEKEVTIRLGLQEQGGKVFFSFRFRFSLLFERETDGDE